MNISKTRMLWADNLKAFTITLVILRHAWSGLEMGENITIHYVSVLHMPLFMIISGYCSYKETVNLRILTGRFWQLVIPFLCWPLVWHLLRWDFHNIANDYQRLIIKTDDGLWFLITLFYIIFLEYIRCSVINAIEIKSKKVHKNKVFTYYVSVFTTATIVYIIWYLYHIYLAFPGNWINFIAIYYPYYCLGNIMRKNNESFFKNLCWLGPIGLVLFLLVTPFTDGYVWQYILATAGTCGTYYIFIKFLDKPMSNLITFIGLNTLGLYAVHHNIIYYVRHIIIEQPVWIDWLLTIIITYAISITAIWLLKKTKLTAFLFLGIPIKR